MFGNNKPPDSGANPKETTDANKNIFAFNQMQQPQKTTVSSSAEPSKFVFNLPTSSTSSSNRNIQPLFGQTPSTFAELNTNKNVFGNTSAESSTFSHTNTLAGPPIQYHNQPKTDSVKRESTNLFGAKTVTFAKPFTGTSSNAFGGTSSIPVTGATTNPFGGTFSNSFGQTNSNPFGGSSQLRQTNIFGSKQVATTTSEQPIFYQFNSPRTESTTNTTTTKASTLFPSTSNSSAPVPSIFGGHNLTHTPQNSSAIPNQQTTFAIPKPLSKSIFGGSDLPVTSETVTRFEPAYAEKAASKNPTMEVEVLKKSEALSDLRFKKPHLNRSKLSGGLFSQALAGLRTSKFKESKDTKKRYQSPEEKDVHAVAKRESRTATAEEINQLKSVICHGIAPEFMSGEFLKKHFSKFGKVTKLYPNHAKRSAVVHFQTHADAANAKQHGSRLNPDGEPLSIFWSLSALSSRKKQTASKPKNQPKKMEESNDVNEELRSMAFNTTDLEEQYIVNSKKERKSPVKVKHERTVETSHRFTQEQTDLLKSQAKTAKEKFQILDLRDRLLRTNRIKQSNIRTARAIVGTCLDMCPEKERYLREDGGRLPSFEMAVSNAGESQEINHKAAIKEYSRSSADQEEPLPHELRPVSALSMTMDYLVCNVMDCFERLDNPTEWYDFVWNRTRSIRKDITQQHLCDITSAALVEKCARFHIHCAERLCEEDMISFDQKINNENLTKCLQTLKHFYHDLQLKNVLCPCEAEFRGYDILLNLNQGDILREVQQLSLHVQKSEPVAFAVKVFNALNSNNYVRFFKLVRGATYLNACILHRYFNQVRNKALYVLIRAYSLHRPTHFPLQEFIYMLGFENENYAADFCTLHGLTIEHNDVVLDKGTFYQPDAIPVAKRAQQLIESKRNSSVGEIVHSGPLPPNPALTYQPHSSFDENGYLHSEAILAEDHTQVSESDSQTNVDVLEIPQVDVKDVDDDDDDVVIISQPDQADTTLNEMTKDLAKDLFMDVTNEIAKEIVIDHMNYSMSLNNYLNEIVEAFTSEEIANITREFSEKAIKDQIEEQKHVEEMRMLQEQEEREIRFRALVAVGDELINETVTAELVNDTSAVIDELKAGQQENDILQSSKTIVSELIDEVTREVMRDTCEVVYKEDVVTVREKLKLIASRIRLLQARDCIHHWRRIVIKRKRHRRNLKVFPCVPGLLAYKMEATPLHKHSNTLPMKRLKNQENLSRLMDVSYFSHQLENRLRYLPIDISSLVAPILLRSFNVNEVAKYSKKLYWKLALSLPDAKEAESSYEISEWFTSKLSSNEFCEKNNKQIETINVSGLESNFHRIGVCVKKVVGVLNNWALQNAVEEKLLQGTNAVLFVVYYFSDSNQEFWLEQQRRLEQILALHNGDPCPVLGVLVFGYQQEMLSESIIADLMNLKNLIRIGKYFVRCFTYVQQSEMSKGVTACLENLAKNTTYIKGFRSQNITTFMDKVVTKYFSEPVYHNLSTRTSMGLVHQSVNTLIALFNFVVAHAAKVISSDSLQNLSWPPSEFVSLKLKTGLPSLNWNDEQYRMQWFQTINQLTLPEYEFNEDDENWLDVKESIFRYINSLIDRNIGDLGLKSRVEKLVSSSQKVHERDCCIKFRIAGCEQTFDNFPWTEFIHFVIEYRLNSVINQNQKEADIYYLEDELAAIKFPLLWKRAVTNNHKTISQSTFINLQNSARKRKSESSWISNSKKRHHTISVMEDTQTTRNLNHVKKFLSRLQAEKEATKRHEQQLQEIILETSLPLQTSTPVVGRNIRSHTQPNDIEVMIPARHQMQLEYGELQNNYRRSNLDLNEKLKQLQAEVESEKQRTKLFDIRFQMVLQNLQ